jgi:hypothetical protein
MTRWIVIVFLIVVLFSETATAKDQTILAEINAKVTQLAGLLKDSYAKEYPDYRGVKISKSTDDKIFVVVVFSIEGFCGGNNHTQFMAVFLSTCDTSERFRLLDFMAVGGRDSRSLEFKNIEITEVKNSILITVPTLELGPNDPLCCPSVKSKVRFTIDPYAEKRLRELKKEN